jgi:hypothetical protein
MFGNLDEFEAHVTNRVMTVLLDRVVQLWLTQPYTRHILSVRNVETSLRCNILEMMVNTQKDFDFSFEMMRSFVSRSSNPIRDLTEKHLPSYSICEYDFDGDTVMVTVTPS